MKLYEVDMAIQEVLMKLEDVIDPDTGEILSSPDAADEVLSELEALQMEKIRILEYLAKVTLNTRAEAAAIKAEEDRLKKRRQSLEHKEERLMGIIDRECEGEKTDLGIAVVSYRKSEKLDVTDPKAAIAWLQANGHDDCIKIADPEVRKDDVKKMDKAGTEVPGTVLVTKNNCSLR